MQKLTALSHFVRLSSTITSHYTAGYFNLYFFYQKREMCTGESIYCMQISRIILHMFSLFFSVMCMYVWSVKLYVYTCVSTDTTAILIK